MSRDARPSTPVQEEISSPGPEAMSTTNTRTVEELQENFEAKRNMVRTEMSKKMSQGWTLLDATCPYDGMPLMMDLEDSEVCVICHLVVVWPLTSGMCLPNAKK